MDGVNITIVRQARQAACGLRRGQARRDARLATRRAGTTRARLVPQARPDLPADAQHPGGKPAAPPGPAATNCAGPSPIRNGPATVPPPAEDTGNSEPPS